MKQLLFILLLSSLTFSCKKSEETTDTTDAFAAERDNFFNNLTEPAQAAAQIQATAADFNASLMSNPANYTSYTGNTTKAAANLGIYLADLNYSVAFSQPESTKEHFKAAHELSKAIGIEANVLDFLNTRYAENIAKNDSVKNVITALMKKSTQDLQGSDREALAGIAMSAFQVENLHLALGTILSYPKDILPDDARTIILVPLFKMVLNQRDNVVMIGDFLKTLNDPSNPNPNYTYQVNAFNDLIGIYDRLNVDEKIANNQGLELMNDAVVLELNDKVNSIRNKVLSVE
jgi:hypothetical protein